MLRFLPWRKRKAGHQRTLDVKLDPTFDRNRLRKVGSDYGGWVYADGPQLVGSTVLLAGAGEDISFDIEFASRYGAKVVILDPTPRAIEHFDRVIKRIGLGATTGYSLTGLQPVESYDLSNVSEEQLTLVPKALVSEDGPVEFFSPVNPSHVSHSVTNWQRGFSGDGESIRVDGVSPSTLTDEFGWNHFPLVKLDIEGAEIEVLPLILQFLGPASQLLVEFDELYTGAREAQDRARETIELLRQRGFVPVWRKGHDFLFIGSALMDEG
jgi:FkbM family methyltransferase